MTYTRKNGMYRLETPYGVFTGIDEARVKLEALMAENSAKRREEMAEEHRQMVLDEQRRVLEFNEARRGV